MKHDAKRLVTYIKIGNNNDAWVKDDSGKEWYDSQFTFDYDVNDELPSGLEEIECCRSVLG